MRGNKIPVMIGTQWFESIKEAEVTLGVYCLRDKYNSAVNKGKIPTFNGQIIHYNVEKPVIYREKTKKVHRIGEPLISKPITCWLGSH